MHQALKKIHHGNNSRSEAQSIKTNFAEEDGFFMYPHEFIALSGRLIKITNGENQATGLSAIWF